MLLVPTFVILLLVIRGTSVLLYRNEITRAQRFSFALCSAVPSLSIIVVITEIGLRSKTMSPDIAAALVGAGLLCHPAVPDDRRRAATEDYSSGCEHGCAMIGAQGGQRSAAFDWCCAVTLSVASISRGEVSCMHC